MLRSHYQPSLVCHNTRPEGIFKYINVFVLIQESGLS